MTPQKIQAWITYWRKTAAHDYDTMEGLFTIKRYSDSLFFGHIVLEKVLKAHVVKKTKRQAPYTHDLILLAEIIQLPFLKNSELLADVNQFNTRARYPDQKFEFYKKCTKNYAENYLKKIKHSYKQLCLELKK